MLGQELSSTDVGNPKLVQLLRKTICQSYKVKHYLSVLFTNRALKDSPNLFEKLCLYKKLHINAYNDLELLKTKSYQDVLQGGKKKETVAPPQNSILISNKKK